MSEDLRGEDRESLRERVDALESQLEAASAEREEARTRVEALTSQREIRVKLRIQRRRRRVLWSVGGLGLLLSIAAVGWVELVNDFEREVLLGTVSEVEGASPSEIGDACTVILQPAGYAPFDAKLQVDCGGQRLYGGWSSWGFVDCDVSDVRVEHCEDDGPMREDGDPHIVFDRAQLEMDDGARWRMVVDLSEPGAS